MGTSVYREDCVQSVEHVPELLFLFVGQGREQTLHFPGLEVGDFEDVAKKELGVDLVSML
jgi:hypothetical protein